MWAADTGGIATQCAGTWRRPARRYNAAMAASPFPRVLAWKPLAGRALELALNQLLALDPDTRDAVRRLDGRHVVVRLAAPELALRLDVDGDRLRVGAVEGDAEADLSVRGTLAGLLAQLPLLQRSGASGTGRVRIEGDADLARQLQQLARGFDPDWQAPFVRVFGEVAGVQIADLLAGALRRADIAGRNLAGTTAEFLTEESRDLVGRNELEAFLDDVDALRDGVERVDARVRRLRTLASERGITMPGAGR